MEEGGKSEWNPMVEEELNDKGPWTASEDGLAITSDDNTHDVILRVAGDFYDNAQRKAYTENLCTKLNRPSEVLRPEDAKGTVVLVNGEMVAWFANFDEAAQEWCTENYFGQWLTWRATRPQIIPLTKEELALVEQQAERMASLFKHKPEAE